MTVNNNLKIDPSLLKTMQELTAKSDNNIIEKIMNEKIASKNKPSALGKQEGI